MLAGIIFPADPVEGRLVALRFEEEMDQLKREGAFVCGNGRQFGLFLVVPKGWRKLGGIKNGPEAA